MQGIKVTGLTKRYMKEGRPVDVLRGVDVIIPQGEMVSIVGQSGAGKSTLLHILGTLDKPTSGTVQFDGQDVFARSSKNLAKFRNEKIGFVFQFHHLLPEFTALENVAMPSLIHRRTQSKANQEASALLERVGLGNRMDHKPGELSGGEQQRVALARALVMKPRLLLADEPTGNLDQDTGQGIHELFQELNASMGISIVIVTHDPRLALRMPRRLRMEEGRLLDVSKESPAPGALVET